MEQMFRTPAEAEGEALVKIVYFCVGSSMLQVMSVHI